jgi:Arc/MetJ-type ribon-helix-helix transcriptional regulator
MKVSDNLPEDEVRNLDEQAANGRYASRSAGVASAIRTMRLHDLTDSYVQAFDEWAASDDAALWDVTVSDGLAEKGCEP